MKIKKIASLVMAVGMIMAMTAGCAAKAETTATTTPNTSSGESTGAAVDSTKAEVSDGTSIKLTFMTNVVGERATALETAIKGFEEETGYTVEFSAPGSDYENLMKVKMGSNELPDVFTTHGWSVARYSDYLMTVNDQSWFSSIDKQILPAITDNDGNVFVLPIDVDVAGIVYNADVLKTAGIDVDSIKTWSDFAAACETLLSKGYEPIHMGGKDTWPIGQFFDWVAPSFYITNDADNQSDALKSGKFDAAIWESISSMMSDWVKAGYFNEDVLTADYNADIDALAKGETAFCFYGNYAGKDAASINSTANIGMMPIPSNSAEDEPSLITGEDIAVGIWKDTTHAKEAQELLAYLARPEVMSAVATAAGNKAGLTTATSDVGKVQEYLDKYSTVSAFPYFDRAYLPSGLWDVMCSTGAEILAGTDNAVKNAATEMEQNFTDKFSA